MPLFDPLLVDFLLSAGTSLTSRPPVIIKQIIKHRPRLPQKHLDLTRRFFFVVWCLSFVSCLPKQMKFIFEISPNLHFLLVRRLSFTVGITCVLDENISFDNQEYQLLYPPIISIYRFIRCCIVSEGNDIRRFPSRL